MVDRAQCGEGIPLACMIAFTFKKCLNQVRGIRYQGFRVMVYRRDGEDSVLPDVSVPMF